MPVKRKKNTASHYPERKVRPMKRNKPINLDHLKVIEPLTPNQETVFEAYAAAKNLVLHGCAGTGKTFYLTIPCTTRSIKS